MQWNHTVTKMTGCFLKISRHVKHEISNHEIFIEVVCPI